MTSLGVRCLIVLCQPPLLPVIYPIGPLCIYFGSQFCVSWVCKQVGLYVCFLCIFLGSFPSVFPPVLLCYILFYHIILIHLLEACLFSNKIERGWIQMHQKWGETRRSSGRGNSNPDILYEQKKNPFSKREKASIHWEQRCCHSFIITTFNLCED